MNNNNGQIPEVGRVEDLKPSNILTFTSRVHASKAHDEEQYRKHYQEYGNGKYLFSLDELAIHKVISKKGEDTEKLLCNFTLDLISEHRYQLDEYSAPIITRVIRFCYYRQGLKQTVVEQLSHDESFKLPEFKQRINGIGQLIFYGDPFDLLELFRCLDEEQQPKIVQEYDYDGLIKHRGHRYYLTENSVFKLPAKKNEQVKAFPLLEGQYFKVADGQYLSLKKTLKKTARFEPELLHAIEQAGNNLSQIVLSQEQISAKIAEFTDLLGNMVAGQTGQIAWGKALFGYMMHFLFLDLLRSAKGPQHGLFLYLYGHGNSGKGELAKIISAFFGGSTIDMHSKPTESALGSLLSQRSARPLFIDEFKPESVSVRDRGSGGIIKDQTLNSAYQFEGRNIKDIATGQVKNEHVRTCAAFLSNYKPETDHLKSRMILLEMSVSRRGDEQFLNQLKAMRTQLQVLFLSLLNSLPHIDQNLLMTDQLLIKQHLASLTKHKAKQQLGGNSPTILDRQITSWALFISLYQHSLPNYRLQRYASQNIQFARLDQDLVSLATDELLNNLIEMDDFNPLIKWLDTVAELVHQKKIAFGQHYGYAETNGLKGQKHLGLRMGRIEAIYKKEYRDMAVVTRQTVESLLLDKMQATRQKKMCFTYRSYSQEQKILSSQTVSWAGIKITQEQAMAKDAELWEKLTEAFPEAN